MQPHPKTNSDVRVLDVLQFELVESRHPNSRAFERKRRVDSEMQLPAGTVTAKGIPRRRKCSLSHRRPSRERAWETRHVRRDTEWHPKRATSRATDTVNIAFGRGDVYRMLHAFSRSEHISGVSGRKPRFYPGPGEAPVSLLRRLVTHNG